LYDYCISVKGLVFNDWPLSNTLFQITVLCSLYSLTVVWCSYGLLKTRLFNSSIIWNDCITQDIIVCCSYALCESKCNKSWKLGSSPPCSPEIFWYHSMVRLVYHWMYYSVLLLYSYMLIKSIHLKLKRHHRKYTTKGFVERWMKHKAKLYVVNSFVIPPE